MRKNATRLLAIIVLFGLAFLLHRSGLISYLNLESLKAEKASIESWVNENAWQSRALYFGIYFIVTAFSFPGAAVLTLAGGALFGTWMGVALVSFASSLGATAAFLFSRFLLRDWVRARFRDLDAKINSGIQKEGALYLLSLRLIPVFPFFIVNLLMGLTQMKPWPFYWVSQVGMLFGTLVYVQAGTELAKLNSLKDVLSPSLLLTFTVLGLLPVLSRRVLTCFKSWLRTKKFRKPKSYDYNLVVIGGGSAGLVSSYIAATVKSKVALIEKHKMGGDCLNTGCVPSKALIRSARVLGDSRKAKELGFQSIETRFDFSELMNRVQRIIHKIEPHDSVKRYQDLGVDCISGQARIVSPYEVQVGDRTITTRAIVIATGARPAVPQLPGIEQTQFVTSDTLWSLKPLPERFLVLGGGPIGCELAQCFARLGSRVVLVEQSDRLLSKEDPEVSKVMESILKKDGVDVRVQHQAQAFHTVNSRKSLDCTHQGQTVRIDFDQVLVALGRRANTENLGLEALGISTRANGTVECDEYLRTSMPNIFACGDVAGPYQFTHTASHQAWYASVNSLFGDFKLFKADYRVIPWATFTEPEVARVGLNEIEATEKGIPYEATLYELSGLDRAICESAEEGFVKVLTEKDTDRILGATIVAAHASDMILEFVTAMKFGIGLNKILGTIHIYPTFGEANKFTAGAWKKNHAPETLLKWVKRFHSWRRNA